MPVAKKLAVVVSVLVAGTSTALFFRKDASEIDESARRQQGIALHEAVERRLPPGRPATNRGGFAPVPVMGRIFKIPTAATQASMGSKSSDLPPSFHNTFSPMGALLKPPAGEGAGESGSPDESDEPSQVSESIAQHSDDAQPWLRTHQVVDGDTLSKLATAYLGRADRYLEIYDLNRDVLTSPDLLPIGATLKLPPRTPQGNQSAPIDSGQSSATAQEDAQMVPVPPGALRFEAQ